MGVISLGCHTRPACTQGFTRFIKTMPRMWIQLLCVRVLYSYGVTWILWPYMGIVTSHKSHGPNARCWLVERNFAALWLVDTYCSHYYYFCICFTALFSSYWLLVVSFAIFIAVPFVFSRSWTSLACRSSQNAMPIKHFWRLDIVTKINIINSILCWSV